MNSIIKCFTLGLCAIPLFISFSCNAPSHEPGGETRHNESEESIVLSPAQVENAGIRLGRVELRPISATVRASGHLDVPPQQVASISVPFGGFLKSTSLLQGSKVKKGQLIAVMENPEYIQLQQDYLEAVNQLEFSKADYDRQARLSEENVNAQKTLQLAKSVHQSWMVKKKGYEAKLRMLNIDVARVQQGEITGSANVYATLDGFVTQVNVNIGKYVNPADVLFEIVDTEHLHAELIIFEKDIPRVKIGQKVRFTLANEDSERMATVYLIGREISNDRTIRIHCHIDQEDSNLLPGMYLQAVVEVGATQVKSLPEAAIVDFREKKYIFVNTHGSSLPSAAGEKGNLYFKMVEVKAGNSESGYREVMLPDDWKKDNQVVVQGAYAILSKAKNSEEEGHAH